MGSRSKGIPEGNLYDQPYRVKGNAEYVSGCLESHELKHMDNVLFIFSLPAQVPLGLVKNLSRGTASLEHEGEVELCRCVRSGLLVIRIDRFDVGVSKMMGRVRLSTSATRLTCRMWSRTA